MNKDIIQGKWKEIKGEIQKAWGNVTGDELDQAKGNMTAISGIIQKRYGEKKDVVERRLGDIYERFAGRAGQIADDTKKAAVDATERTKESLRN